MIFGRSIVGMNKIIFNQIGEVKDEKINTDYLNCLQSGNLK